MDVLAAKINGRWRLAAAGIIALHVAIGWRLANDGLELRPDSADFMLGARSIALGEGYHDLSNPNHPPIDRPIGTSLLLAPVMAISPYNVLASKAVMLATSALTLLFAWLILRRTLAPERAALVLLLLALSPIELHHASQVLSENPFTTATMAAFALVIAFRQPETPIAWKHWAAACLFCFVADITRTQGILLLGSLFAWGMLQSNRRMLMAWIAATVGVVVVPYIAPYVPLGKLFGPQSPPITRRYLPHFEHVYGSGFELGASVWASITYYLGLLGTIVLPVSLPELFEYDLSAFSSIPGWIATALGACVIVTIAISFGKDSRRGERRAEAVALVVYIAATLLLLVVWPHRMSRLLVPVIPLATILFWRAVFEFWPNRGRWLAGIVLAAHAFVAVLMAWSGPTGRTGAESARLVGKWLQENTPPWTAVVTSDKELFFYSKRYQTYTPPHGLIVDELASAIQQDGATFLRFDEWQTDPLLTNNPTYKFRPIDIHGVLEPLFEILPNEDGTVSLDPPDVSGEVQKIDEALFRSRRKRDILLVRKAYLLLVGGRLDEAEQELREFIASAGRTVGTTSARLMLGEVLIEAGRYDEAREAYLEAKAGANADFFAREIAAGLYSVSNFKQAISSATLPSQKSLFWKSVSKTHEEHLRLGPALAALEKAIDFNELDLDARSFSAGISYFVGHYDEAKRVIENLMMDMHRAQSPAGIEPSPKGALAVHKLLELRKGLLKGEKTVVGGEDFKMEFDPNSVSSYFDAAIRFERASQSGVAVKLLRTAAHRFRDSDEFWFRLVVLLDASGLSRKQTIGLAEIVRLAPAQYVPLFPRSLQERFREIPRW